MSAAGLAWVDGRFVEAGTAALSPFDPGCALGVGVFETLGAAGGRLPLWSCHLDRLAFGAAVLGIAWAPPAGLHAAAAELLSRTGQPDGILRVTLTGGGAWCLTTRPRRAVDLVRLVPVATARGPEDPTASIKCLSRAALVLAQRAAAARGGDDALLVDARGRALEATYGSLFVVDAGGVLHTPRLDGALLPGVARAELLAGLAAHGVGVRARDLLLTEVAAARALVVTNAVYGPRLASLPGAAPGAPDDPVVALLQHVWAERLARAAGG